MGLNLGSCDITKHRYPRGVAARCNNMPLCVYVTEPQNPNVCGVCVTSPRCKSDFCEILPCATQALWYTGTEGEPW